MLLVIVGDMHMFYFDKMLRLHARISMVYAGEFDF